MKIKVTKEHISKGQVCDDRYCPVALAIKDVSENKDVTVGIDDVVVNRQHDYIHLPLPLKAKRFISAFDDLEPVKPFSFNLNL